MKIDGFDSKYRLISELMHSLPVHLDLNYLLHYSNFDSMYKGFLKIRVLHSEELKNNSPFIMEGKETKIFLTFISSLSSLVLNIDSSVQQSLNKDTDIVTALIYSTFLIYTSQKNVNFF